MVLTHSPAVGPRFGPPPANTPLHPSSSSTPMPPAVSQPVSQQGSYQSPVVVVTVEDEPGRVAPDLNSTFPASSQSSLGNGPFYPPAVSFYLPASDPSVSSVSSSAPLVFTSSLSQGYQGQQESVVSTAVPQNSAAASVYSFAFSQPRMFAPLPPIGSQAQFSPMYPVSDSQFRAPGAPVGVFVTQAAAAAPGSRRAPGTSGPDEQWIPLSKAQEALVEMRMKYEQEKARREAYEMMITHGQVTGKPSAPLPMANLSLADASHSHHDVSQIPDGVGGFSQTQPEALRKLGFANPLANVFATPAANVNQGGYQYPPGPGIPATFQQQPTWQNNNQYTSQADVTTQKPRPDVNAQQNPANQFPRPRTDSVGSNGSLASSAAASQALQGTQSTRKYRLKKPPVFKSADTPDAFDRFIRHFELHMKSNGCDDKEEWVQVLEPFLDGTPRLVYTQLSRDRSTITYDQMVAELRVIFGKPKDPRMVLHKLHEVAWNSGETLVDLAARIRDLHYQAHSKTPVDEREIYAGDTFYRLVPQRWRVKMREKNQSTLSEYLVTAIECQEAEKENKESSKPGSVRSVGETSEVDSAVDTSHSAVPAATEVQQSNSTNSGPKPFQRKPKFNNWNKPQQRGEPPTCFFCHVKGHIAPHCKQKAEWLKAKQAQNSNQQQSAQSFDAATAPTQQTDSSSSGGPPAGSRFVQALQQKGGANRLVTAHGDVRKVSSVDRLVSGSVYHPVVVEGLQTQALLDIGSVINIVSMEFLLQVADSVGCESMLQKCKALDSSFDGYGGKPILDFHVYLPLDVGCGDSAAVSPLLCVVDESGHPEADILLSSGGMRDLGFKVVSPNNQELLSPSMEVAGSAEVGSVIEGVPHEGKVVRRVSLAPEKAVRIGSLRSASLNLKVEGDLPVPRKGHGWMFSPVDELAEEGLSIEDALIQPHNEETFSLPVTNFGCWPVVVYPRELGTLEEVELVPSEEHAESKGSVSRVAKADNGHRQKVSEKLKISDVPGSEQVRELCLEFHHLFAFSDDELGIATGAEHHIDTGDRPPIAHRCRRLPYALRDKVEAKMQDDIRAGKLEPSNSPWAAPIVVVRKPNGDIRICGDYTDLNNITVKDSYPLKHCHDLLDSVGKMKPCFFTTLDLRSGYHQIRVSEESRQKTAIIYHGGLLQWRVMPFGLCNAPATFQRLINEIFRDFPPDRLHSFLDDLLLPSESLEEHLRILRRTFERLEQVGLSLHPDKCHFLLPQVRYLGFIVTKDGLVADREKVRAVQEFPTPRTKTDMKSFLGLASYYRRFIKDFAKIAKPLTDSLAGDFKFLTWTIECQVAFERLKRVLTEAPVLVYPDLQKPFFLETDGSKLGPGAVLAQQDGEEKLQPVAYGSRTLRGAEVRYAPTDLELLGVVYALKHFKVYIYGSKVTLITDHKSLVDMIQKTHELASDRQERWKQQIRNFEVTLYYRKGSENKVADALSRYPVADPSSKPETVLRVISSPAQSFANPSNVDPSQLDTIRESQRKDPSLFRIITFKEDGILPEDEKLARWLRVMDPRFHIMEGILFYVDSSDNLRLKVVVPEPERDHLLWDLHCSPLGGHLGMEKTVEKVCREYYWPRMRQEIVMFLRSCIICASRSGQGRHYKPPLQPLPVPDEPFQVVASDIVKLCRTRNGNLYALVTTDLLSKFVMVSPMPDMSAETVVKAFLRDVLPFGAPMHVLTDRGTQFTSELMSVICETLQVKQLFTTTFHPQCDGQTERVNQTLEAMLSKCSSVRGDDWDEVLPFVAYAYNSSVHASTKHVPYYVLFGRKPRLPSSSVFAVANDYFTLEHDDDYKTMIPFYLQIAWDAAKEASEKAKKRQKAQYDKTAIVPPFKVGDKVFVQSRELVRSKLSRKYRGPGLITRLTPTNAVVQLRMGQETVERKFHLDKLTKAYPELGNRVFTGSPKHPVLPPAIPRSVGATEHKEGGEEQMVHQRSKQSQKSSHMGPQSSSQSHSYNLRPRSREQQGVRRVRLSLGRCSSWCGPLILLSDSSGFGSGFSSGKMSSGSSGAGGSEWRPWRSGQPPQRFQPYTFVRNLASRVVRGLAPSSRISLQSHQEPAVSRLEIRNQSSFSRMSHVVPYQEVTNKTPGVDYVPIPNDKLFQTLDFYSRLPYRIQGQLYNNPFTQSELNLEMVPPTGSPVIHPAVVDNLIFVHTGFRPDFPIQYDIITSRVALVQALRKMSLHSKHPFRFFSLVVDSVVGNVAKDQLYHHFGLTPYENFGPWAVSMTLTSPEFATIVIDLRKVCLPPVGDCRHCTLPPELSEFLKDPYNVFVMMAHAPARIALRKLCGVILQSSVLEQRSGLVSIIDLSIMGAELGIGQWMGLSALMRWTQDNHLPVWVTMVTDQDLPEGVLSRFFWVELPPAVTTNLATRSAWVMYSSLHLVLRHRRAPRPLQPLQDKIRLVYAFPTVAFNRIELASDVSFAYGQSNNKAERVAEAWMRQADRSRLPSFCCWLDGLDILRSAFAEVAGQLRSFPLNTWDRQLALLKFVLACGARWRLKFDPQGSQPGATLPVVRRPL